MHATRLKIDDFASALLSDITANRVRLPTLPDVALRVKKAVQEDCSGPEIAAIVAQDIAVSGRLMQIANSPLYRRAAEVDSILAAVTRLGTNLVRGLVITLAIKQMFNTSSKTLSTLFHGIWKSAVEVAAISRVLGELAPNIDPDEAMLAGLLFNIGALPILTRLDETGVGNQKTAQQLIDRLAPDLGTLMLRSWRLPDALVAVPKGCQRLERDPGPQIEYADIVLAARLQHQFSAGLLDITPEISSLPALQKLGIHFEVVVLEEERQADWATTFSEMLVQ